MMWDLALAMSISVIVPAYNEEHYLPSTLSAVQAARRLVPEEVVEVIVVDNASTDGTATVAAQAGAMVVYESRRSVARARNAGASSATGDFFVFVDADTVVPETLLQEIAAATRDPTCVGGAVDVQHVAQRLVVRFYLRIWRIIGIIAGMAQGAVQFCRRGAFKELSGYDEALWMGEDVDFYWRLKMHARRKNARVIFLRKICVVPSARRFDRWPLWKIVVFTNPVFAMLFRRRRWAWRGWYDDIVR